jgi:hypothetical protein
MAAKWDVHSVALLVATKGMILDAVRVGPKVALTVVSKVDSWAVKLAERLVALKAEKKAEMLAEKSAANWDKMKAGWWVDLMVDW